MTANREIVLTDLPVGELKPDHFALQQGTIGEPGDGELLVRNVLLSIDAANRAWMQGATYREAVKAGDVMHTYALAQVVASQDSNFAPGELVTTESRWADYALVKARHAVKVKPTGALAHQLSVYGIAGKTAYHGLLGVGRPAAGETVVVSAAAGSVGIYVGQIARANGCRVVGIAGGAQKCEWVCKELGFDACIDYREKGLFGRLREACPDGIDVYFDNVGGVILETVLFQMNLRGRIVCCGAVSQYNETSPAGPRNLPGLVVVKRLRMEGFIVMDFHQEDDKAQADLERWVAAGEIKAVEDIFDGLERAPAALIGLLAGDNRGKRLVRVAPDP